MCAPITRSGIHAKPVPMDSYMAEDLLRWRRQSVYASDDHYVFASETMRGKQPYWPDNLMKRHIQPVAKAIGIHKKIGWHTFRHSFGTLLKANGEDVKTVQELLRHANSRITLDVFAGIFLLPSDPCLIPSCLQPCSVQPAYSSSPPACKHPA